MEIIFSRFGNSSGVLVMDRMAGCYYTAELSAPDPLWIAHKTSMRGIPVRKVIAQNQELWEEAWLLTAESIRLDHGYVQHGRLDPFAFISRSGHVEIDMPDPQHPPRTIRHSVPIVDRSRGYLEGLVVLSDANHLLRPDGVLVLHTNRRDASFIEIITPRADSKVLSLGGALSLNHIEVAINRPGSERRFLVSIVNNGEVQLGSIDRRFKEWEELWRVDGVDNLIYAFPVPAGAIKGLSEHAVGIVVVLDPVWSLRLDLWILSQKGEAFKWAEIELGESVHPSSLKMRVSPDLRRIVIHSPGRLAIKEIPIFR